jgi:hypothetical protein
MNWNNPPFELVLLILEFYNYQSANPPVPKLNRYWVNDIGCSSRYWKSRLVNQTISLYSTFEYIHLIPSYIRSSATNWRFNCYQKDYRLENEYINTRFINLLNSCSSLQHLTIFGNFYDDAISSALNEMIPLTTNLYSLTWHLNTSQQLFKHLLQASPNLEYLHIDFPNAFNNVADIQLFGTLSRLKNLCSFRGVLFSIFIQMSQWCQRLQSLEIKRHQEHNVPLELLEDCLTSGNLQRLQISINNIYMLQQKCDGQLNWSSSLTSLHLFGTENATNASNLFKTLFIQWPNLLHFSCDYHLHYRFLLQLLCQHCPKLILLSWTIDNNPSLDSYQQQKYLCNFKHLEHLELLVSYSTSNLLSLITELLQHCLNNGVPLRKFSYYDQHFNGINAQIQRRAEMQQQLAFTFQQLDICCTDNNSRSFAMRNSIQSQRNDYRLGQKSFQ